MNCVFCKIVNKEINSYIINEDEKHLAILDIFPNTYGQVVVIPKKHIESNFLNIDDKEFLEIIYFAKNTSRLIKEKLNVERVALVIEGTAIDHFHIKLYPIDKKLTYDKEKVWFDEYPGFITTKTGMKLSDDKLKEIQKKLTS